MSERNEAPKQQSVAKGFMILTIAMMSVKVIGVIYTPLLTLILGKEGFGIYYSAYTIFTFIYTVANSGVQAAIAKIVSELEAVGNYRDAEKSFRAARFLYLAFGFLLALLLFVFAAPISSMFNSEGSTLAIMCLAPGILFTALMCAYKGYFQGIGNMTPISIALVGEQILNLIFSISFAALLIKYGGQFGAAGGTVGTLIGALLAALYLMLIYKRSSNKHRTYVNKPNTQRLSNKTIINSILKYAVPITIGSALQQSGAVADLFIVKERLLKTGLTKGIVDAQYGFLGQYNTLISVPMAIIGALATAILPAISRVNTLKDKKHLRFSIKSTYRVTLIIAIPCAVGLSVIAYPITTILGYDPMVATLLIWGAWSLVLYAMTLVQTSILQGMGKMTLVTVYSVIGIAVKIIINFILVGNAKIGLMGAVLGNAACYLIMMVLFQRYINKGLGKISLVPCGAKPLLAGIIMGIATYFTFNILASVLGIFISGYILNLIASILTIGISAIVYGIVLIIIGGLKETDLRVLPGKLAKLIPSKLTKYIK